MKTILYTGDTKTNMTVFVNDGKKEGSITRMTAKTVTVECRYGGMDPRIVRYNYRAVEGSWKRGGDLLRVETEVKAV